MRLGKRERAERKALNGRRNRALALHEANEESRAGHALMMAGGHATRKPLKAKTKTARLPAVNTGQVGELRLAINKVARHYRKAINISKLRAELNKVANKG